MEPNYTVELYRPKPLTTKILVFNWKGMNEVGLANWDESPLPDDDNLVAIFKFKFNLKKSIPVI